MVALWENLFFFLYVSHNILVCILRSWPQRGLDFQPKASPCTSQSLPSNKPDLSTDSICDFSISFPQSATVYKLDKGAATSWLQISFHFLSSLLSRLGADRPFIPGWNKKCSLWQLGEPRARSSRIAGGAPTGKLPPA